MIVITIRITNRTIGITTTLTRSTEVILGVIVIGSHIITLLVITIDVPNYAENCNLNDNSNTHSYHRLSDESRRNRHNNPHSMSTGNNSNCDRMYRDSKERREKYRREELDDHNPNDHRNDGRRYNNHRYDHRRDTNSYNDKRHNDTRYKTRNAPDVDRHETNNSSHECH